MSASPLQILQIELAKKFDCRQDKIDFLSSYFKRELQSSKELTPSEMVNVTQFLKTGNVPSLRLWGAFDKANKQHMQILSLCMTYGWTKGQYADLNSLSSWLQSKKSPVRKPLIDMSSTELSQIINALSGMVKSKYK